MHQTNEEALNERPVATSRAVIEDLKARQIAFLKGRLSSAETREAWKQTVADVLSELRSTPLGRLCEPSSLADVIDAVIAQATQEMSRGPVQERIDRLARDVHAMLVRERAPIGTFVPPSAREALSSLFARPDMVPPKLVREIAEQEAAREVMRDILYDALKQFSERVNPFVAEWGLPSLLKKLGPFGMGGVGKGIDGLRADFERRLDPEIRKFLHGFSRQALKNAADSIVTRADTPPFIALRRRLIGFLFEQRFVEVLLDAEATADVARIGVEMVSRLALHEELAARRRAFVLSWIEEHGEMPLGDVLAALGLPDKPPRELVLAIADATFPAFSAMLSTPAAHAAIAAIVAEFYDGLAVLHEDEL